MATTTTTTTNDDDGGGGGGGSGGGGGGVGDSDDDDADDDDDDDDDGIMKREAIPCLAADGAGRVPQDAREKRLLQDICNIIYMRRNIIYIILYTCVMYNVIYMRYIAAGGAGRVAQDARVPPPQPGALHPVRLLYVCICLCMYVCMYSVLFMF